MQISLPTPINVSANSNAKIFENFDIKNSTITDSVFTGKTLKELFSNKKIKGFIFLGCTNAYCVLVDAIVWSNTEYIGLTVRNLSNSAFNIQWVRFVILYR